MSEKGKYILGLQERIADQSREIINLRALHAAVRGVQHPIYDLMRVIARTAIAKPQFIHDDTLHDWAQELEDVDNILTAALDAAPATGENKRLCIKCGKYPAETAQTYCEFCMGISPPPAPVGIAAADVVKVLKLAETDRDLYKGRKNTMLPKHHSYGYVSGHLDANIGEVNRLRALINAAGEQVCETCEDKHTITCDDYRECINPEKCAWGKVCKDGVFPCPDCATAPRTPTTEQRAAFLHKSGGYYNRAVTIIANVFSGNRDTEVTAWLAEREGGGE